jgi:N-acetylglucosaminyldiphosphoundecaprenol N-acetyl-beta-D-mannosaminyltransferase
MKMATIFNPASDILGVRFDRLSMRDLLIELDQCLQRDAQHTIAFSNPEFVVEALQNGELRDYLNQCKFNVADGYGIIWAARTLRKEGFPERITGTDFLPKFCEMCERRGYSIFFYGGEPGVAQTAADLLVEVYPGLKIAGTQNGYTDQDDELVQKINSSKADALMVCLGNPRQEAWISSNMDRLSSRLIFGNGGALDFQAGRYPRAPKVWRRMHLEWLFRLIQDPSLERFGRQSRLIWFVFAILRSKYFPTKENK